MSELAAITEGLGLIKKTLEAFGLDDAAAITEALGTGALGLIQVSDDAGFVPWVVADEVLDLVGAGLREAGLEVPAQLLGLIRPLVGLLMSEVYKTHLVADGGISVEADMT